jgi:hypothetical protein
VIDNGVMDDAALAEALRRLGPKLAIPETPSDVAARVTAEVEASGRPGGAWPGRPSGRMLLAVAAVLVVVASGLIAVSPRARAIADDLIHLRGLRVQPVSHLPPAGIELHMGRAVNLAEARRLAGRPIARPTGLGHPDAVYVTGAAGKTLVSLVYRARPGLPAAPATGTGLILSEFRGQGADIGFIKKLLGTGTTIDQVTVSGETGYWIAGPQVVLFVGPDGSIATDAPRLSGSSLFWTAGGVTYRLESTLDEAGSLRVANSVR